ncbi:MAG TPA: DHA2 family efflux MFS transporter permease subunit [Acidimicrobiales bacterium]|nr:DHA2 family efflux MFS transporter permease subunit [Acidimicrobiales bacterium]
MRAEAIGHGSAGTGSPRRWLALAVLCVSLLIVTLDNTVLNVALPTLVGRLHASLSDLQWIVDAYVLAFAGLMLVSGSLADRVGRKRTFLAGLVLFAGCSAWAAFSGSVGHLIAARASMGAGGALIMPSTLAVITNTFTDPRERQRAIGLWAATSGAGIAAGPIIGGLLLDHFWWGSVFLVNVPVAALGFALAVPLVPDSRDPSARRPDAVGSLLSVAGLGLLLCAIIEAPVHGWSSALVLGTGIGGLAVLAAFVEWEHRSTHPMLRLAFFRDRRFSAPIVSVSLMMFGLFGSMFVLTQFLQFQLGYTPLQAGVRILPAAGAIAVVAPLADRLVGAAGTRVTIAGALLMAAAGFWQMSGATVDTTYGGVVVGMILVGASAGLVIPSATASVMGSLPQEHTGVGAATNGTFLQTGGALGVAVIGNLLSNRYEGRVSAALAPLHLPQVLEQAVRSSVGAALAIAHQLGGAPGAAVADAARSAFMSGMDLGLFAAAVVALAAAAIALATLPGRTRFRRPPGTGPAAPPPVGQNDTCPPSPA